MKANAADGSYNTTFVTGDDRVVQNYFLEYAVDATLVDDDFIGINHPCGAYYVTIVDGLSRVGTYAANGSYNVVVDDAENMGIQHPCGAYRVTDVTP